MLIEYSSNLDVALLLFTTAYLIRLLFEGFDGYGIPGAPKNKEKRSLLNQAVNQSIKRRTLIIKA